MYSLQQLMTLSEGGNLLHKILPVPHPCMMSVFVIVYVCV